MKSESNSLPRKRAPSTESSKEGTRAEASAISNLLIRFISTFISSSVKGRVDQYGLVDCVLMLMLFFSAMRERVFVQPSQTTL